eukprot:3516588-Heterocapsa_arctica.AAC.1
MILIKVREPAKPLAAKTLLVRINRWLPCPELVNLDNMRDRLLKLGKKIDFSAPGIAVLRVAARGICTARRFQQRCSPCAMCGQSQDSIEHWPDCPALLHALATIRST